MTWYWIILIIIGYFLVAVLTALIYYWYDFDSDEAAVSGFCWPVMLPIAILLLIPFIIENILDEL